MNRHLSQPAGGSCATTGTVLCIEDDPVTQLMLDDVVMNAGAECTIAGSAREAEARLADNRFDLVILDRRLPDSDGLVLMQSIKDYCDCPVIILSRMSDTRDKILGISLGAAEYLTKPINPLELNSRVKSLLEQSRRAAAGDPTVFEFHETVFKTETRKLTIDGTTSFLPPTEARLLHILVENLDDALTRDQLSRFACGREWAPGDRTIDVLVNRLRNRLEQSCLQIITVHRTGYCTTVDP